MAASPLKLNHTDTKLKMIEQKECLCFCHLLRNFNGIALFIFLSHHIPGKGSRIAIAKSVITAQLLPLILIGTGSDCTLWDRISAGWQAQVWASTICTGVHKLTWTQGQQSRHAQIRRHKNIPDYASFQMHTQ